MVEALTLPVLSVRIGGENFIDWQEVEITRDLGEIAAGFTLRIYDAGRISRIGGMAAARARVSRGDPIEIRADGDKVLVGSVVTAEGNWSETALSFSVSGRDLTGDMVDAAAAPDGPAEYRNLKLDDLVRRICAPFGITVRADVDVGAPFPRFSMDPDETALDAIDKACRQRAVLAVSDGIGGLVLTRGGQSRAPAPLGLPGNVVDAQWSSSVEDRFSRYIVKGQSAMGRGNGGPALSSLATPLSDAPTPPAQTERSRIMRRGEAVDPEITRYRPRVYISRTQSGGASLQLQAEWRMRVARGQGEVLSYTVPGWRAGDDRRLWRPNELVYVDDRAGGVDGDMLVRGVVLRRGERGASAELKVIGPEAFDLVDEGVRRRRHHAGAAATGDSTARPLTTDLPPARRNG